MLQSAAAADSWNNEPSSCILCCTLSHVENSDYPLKCSCFVLIPYTNTLERFGWASNGSAFINTYE